MSRVHAFFVEEAAECLRIATGELAREIPDRAVVHRAVRRLRGSAQLARYGGIARAAAALEARIRPARDGGGWSPGLIEAAGVALAGLEEGLSAVRAGEMKTDEEAEETMEGEAQDGVVGIEELEYRGRAALERALELRSAIEDAIVSQKPAGPVLDELFDLIRLGMG